MIMSRQASRLAGDAGTVVPDASRHRLFTAGGQAPGAGGALPAPGRPQRRVRWCAAVAPPSLPCQPRQAAGQPESRPARKEPRNEFPDLYHRAR